MIGTGLYESSNWDELTEVPHDLRRFEHYARRHFPGAHIVREGADHPLDAGGIRERLEVWCKLPESTDDLVIVWAGHGVERDQHYLATYETPHPDDDGPTISTTNALAVTELTPWLQDCEARSIVVIIDTCWAGNGGGELAARLEEAGRNASPTDRADRHCEIIASARNEEATDGQFMTALLAALSERPPQGSGWPEGTTHLSPDRLMGEVNARMTGQQAQSRRAYGHLGDFFPLTRDAPDEALPFGARETIQRDFDEELTERPIVTWDMAGLLEAAGTWAVEAPMLADRLESAAIALSAKRFVIEWLGEANLQGRYEQAWRAERPGTVERPSTLFGYFDDLARGRLSGLAERSGRGRDNSPIVRFVARILHLAGHDPTHQRLFDWAATLPMDLTDVERAISNAAQGVVSARLIIDLAEDCLARGVSEPATRAVGSLLQDDAVVGDPIEVDLVDGIDPAAAIGQIYTIASAHPGAARIDHVDVVLGVAELAAVDPLRVPVRRSSALPVTTELARRASLTVRSGDHLYRDGYRDHPSASRPDHPEEPQWIVPDDDPQALYENTCDFDTAIGLTALPRDPESWAVVLLNTMHLVWHRTDSHCPEHESHVAEAWDRFPACLVTALRDPDPNGLQETAAVWDDVAWLRSHDELQNHRASYEPPGGSYHPQGRMP
ncbi:MAG: hypothetical protein ACFCVK_23005 [Acidimicrobiales bacterium]